jgi:preprotein translocase subunit SecB
MTEHHKKNMEQSFGIQRLYLHDSSFESPNSPLIFENEWQPELNLELSTQTKPLENDHHHVLLKVTATAKVASKVAFIAEVSYAGIFLLQNFEKEILNQMLGSFCPNILYPYIRAIITNLVMEGGFPNLYLAPVNFDALYMQQKERLEQEKNAASESVN